MFFWIGLVVVFVVFVGLFRWGLRGYDDRVHRPGTAYLDRPRRTRSRTPRR